MSTFLSIVAAGLIGIATGLEISNQRKEKPRQGIANDINQIAASVYKRNQEAANQGLVDKYIRDRLEAIYRK